MLMRLDNSRRSVEVKGSEIRIIQDRRDPLPACQARLRTSWKGTGALCDASSVVVAEVRGVEVYLCGMHANCGTNEHHHN